MWCSWDQCYLHSIAPSFLESWIWLMNLMQSAHRHIDRGEKEDEILRILFSECAMKPDGFKLCCLKSRLHRGVSWSKWFYYQKIFPSYLPRRSLHLTLMPTCYLVRDCDPSELVLRVPKLRKEASSSTWFLGTYLSRQLCSTEMNLILLFSVSLAGLASSASTWTKLHTAFY